MFALSKSSLLRRPLMLRCGASPITTRRGCSTAATTPTEAAPSTHCSSSSSPPSASSSYSPFASPAKKSQQTISEVKMQPAFPSHQLTKEELAAPDGGQAAYDAYVARLNAERDDGMPKFDNLRVDERDRAGGDGVMNGGDEIDYRVSWFYYDIHPAMAFSYWAVRRLRELPPDWQHYYRVYLRQEMKSQMTRNNTWDMFIAVVEGYRKGKWILRKFDVPVDESLIPHPYNNFWEVTTPEERAWAYRRSTKMKEQQGMQRAFDDNDNVDDDGEVIDPEAEDDALPDVIPTMAKKVNPAFARHNSHSQQLYGGRLEDANVLNVKPDPNLTSKTQTGNPVHSTDMGAPSECDLRASRLRSGGADTDNDLAMGTIEDDKLWNPVLKNRLYQQRTKAEEDLYAFEDDDEFEQPARG